MALAQLEQHEQFKGDVRWDLVQRVIGSKPFQNSARLRDFLLYVTSCALRETPDEATEQHIGIHVFHRRPGFNSTEDSIVRSQARLLRIKLATYFDSPEGVAEPMVIRIPKGHYLPVFTDNQLDGDAEPALRPEPEVAAVAPHARVSAGVHDEESLLAAMPSQAHQPILADDAAAVILPQRRKWLLWAIGLIGLFAVAAASFLLGKRMAAPIAPDRAVEHLWHPFLIGAEPLVIYSNASFIGDSRTGMRYAEPDGTGSTGSGPLIDTYTGIGELSAVREITRLFDSTSARFVLKRSRLVTWDEAKLHNLIFIGSIAENASLQVLPHADDFVLTAEPGQAGFINRHPKAGEPSRYMRPERPPARDYAVIALRPGADNDLRTFVFSGLTTLGTEAAVEFATSRPGAEQLLAAATSNQQVHPFEALLEVDISGGVPIHSRIVTMRVH